MYDLPQESIVKLTIYDLTGRVVDVLVSEIQSAGRHTAIWEAANSPSGMYLFHLQAGNHSSVKKMMLLK